MNKVVTVFGASGFVGRQVVRVLAGQGWRVRAVCRRPNLAGYLLPNGAPGGIQLFRGNVRSEKSVAKALAGADAVVNSVGVLFGRGAQSFEALHIDAAGTIARCAKAEGVRALTQVSALGADPTAHSRYGQTKGEGERRVREVFPAASVLRPSLIFGPDDRFFNLFAWAARMSPFLPLIGGGRMRLQPVYVGDVASAVAQTLEREDAQGKTFELGGPNVYTLKELMGLVMRYGGRRRLLVPVPFVAAKAAAFFVQMPSLVLPFPPLLAVDYVRQLQRDNVVTAGAATLADLGIDARALETVVPAYLKRFCPKGQFERPSEAQNL